LAEADRANLVARAVALAGDSPTRILAVVGPTASGKTDLAVAVAERVGGEVVSVDSVQIYRGFDIGSGKPSAGELARAPHHLVGIVEPLDAIDAARFAALARAAIADVHARGKRVVLCGGSFLWMKALLYGLAEAPSADPVIRARHHAIAQAKGRPALHEELQRLDPESATRLHPNDVVRVSRALEVYELTGTKLSTWQRDHAFKTAQYDAALAAIRVAPEDLTRRIEARVAAMLAAGWRDEVERLLAAGYGGARAMAAVGYREVRASIEGKLPHAELRAAIVRATRVFARRQRTWLGHEPVTWL
jgi:tRNA dimethylallyltransferase